MRRSRSRQASQSPSTPGAKPISTRASLELSRFIGDGPVTKAPLSAPSSAPGSSSLVAAPRGSIETRNVLKYIKSIDNLHIILGRTSQALREDPSDASHHDEDRHPPTPLDRAARPGARVAPGAALRASRAWTDRAVPRGRASLRDRPRRRGALPPRRARRRGGRSRARAAVPLQSPRDRDAPPRAVSAAAGCLPRGGT